MTDNKSTLLLPDLHRRSEVIGGFAAAAALTLAVLGVMFLLMKPKEGVAGLPSRALPFVYAYDEWQRLRVPFTPDYNVFSTEVRRINDFGIYGELEIRFYLQRQLSSGDFKDQLEVFTAPLQTFFRQTIDYRVMSVLEVLRGGAVYTVSSDDMLHNTSGVFELQGLSEDVFKPTMFTIRCRVGYSVDV